MDEYIEKHLYDVLLSIEETESYFEGSSRVYQDFEKDILRQRAVERNVEIMGEAINRILKIDPDFLWTLIMNHIPALKRDVMELLEK